MRPMFSPSLMCMDLTKFERQVEALNRRAASYHVDIMDGHYVKNITLSPFFITQLKKIAGIPIDAHLMCEAPEDIVPLCLEAGADTISFHPETAGNKIFRLIRQIKGQGRKVGVVLNPSEPVEILSQYLHLLDRITVLSVDPGFAGETFIAETLEKIKQLKKMREKKHHRYLLEIDGSCNEKTFETIAASGVDIFVVGTSGLFGLDEDIVSAWNKMTAIFERETGIRTTDS